MRTLICGLGEVGRHLARDFTERGHDVVAIDEQIEAINDVEQSLDLMTLKGHAALPRTLNQAGVDQADLVVAVTDHDETNLVAALAAQQMGAKHTIARIGDRDYYDDHTGWREGLLGVDLVLCPGLLAGVEVVRLTRALNCGYVENFAGNLVQVMKTAVCEDSQALGKPASRLNLPRACRVLQVFRDGLPHLPSDIPRLQPEDQVVVGGPLLSLAQVDRIFEAQGRRMGSAIVVGGGELGQSVASELRHIASDVTLAERDPATCEHLAETLEGVTIVRGDGTNLSFLEEIGAPSADTFVATTHDDEVNLMGSLLSKRLGVNNAIALLHRPDYAEVFQTLGIDATVSPRLLVSAEVLHFVQRGAGALTSPIGDTASAIIETVVQEGSHLVGQRLFDMNLPHGVFTVAVAHGRRLDPEPELATLNAGDIIVIYAPERAVERTRRELSRR
jgi:trk system potassium uptake protein TrkA